MKTQLVSSIALNTALAVLLAQTFAFAQTDPASPAAPAASSATPPYATAPTSSAAPQQPATQAPADPYGAPSTATAPPAASTDPLAPAAQQPVAPYASATPPTTAATEEQAAAAEQDAQEVAEDLSDEGGKVNIYGFADFTYSQLLSSREAFNVSPHPYSSFYVGNLNLYLDANLGHKWRSLSEIRFTYLPDGAQQTDPATGTAGPRINGAYPDYTDFNRTAKVGGIIMERAWVEYAAHPLFTIRGGQFLTPYGIWNVEHGTTVIIGTTRPYIIGSEMFPNHQTGLEAYGTYAVDSTQVGYHLTVSNGRGPIDQYKDLDKNKAVGWRVWVQQDTSFGTFVLGTSGYKGRYTDRSQTMVMSPTSFGYTYPINSEYKELSLALDLKWNWKGAVFQSEAIMHDVGYENSTRPPAMAFDGGPQGWTPDARNYGFYAIGGYRLPWLGIMPYFGGEYYYLGKSSFIPDSAAFWGGFNIRPTDRVVLKIQETHAFFPSDWVGGMTKPPKLNLLTAQVAWSF